MIFKAQESHAKNMYGITQNIFLVNNTINIHVGGGTDDDSLSSSSIAEDVLAEKLMEASPEFFSRIKFVPEIKKKECVGDMYYCDPATNRWSNCSNMRISKVIKIELKSKFPVEKNNKTNEKIRRDELDDFLRKLMPVDEERDVVLAFFAGLLSGRRKEKKFLAFTDKTSGDNGKSTLMALFGSFFDEYGSSNGTKILTKGSFARSRDDHDAGLKPMKGLLIEHFRQPGRSSIFDNLPVSMTEWKSGIANSANPLTDWLEELVEVTGASSDAVWIGDLKIRWKESHYGHETSSVFSTKLVKAFFVGKQGTEWKESARIEKKVKNGVIKGCKIVDEDAMLIPDVIKDNWYKGDYGLGQVAHFLLKGSVKKTGAGRGGYYIFEEYTCQWVKVDEGRVKSVAVEAMEAALRDVDAWISTSMMVADLDLKRREVLRLIRYTRSHRGVTNVMAFAGPMLRDETFEQGLNIIMVGGGNDTDDDDDDPSSITEDVLAEKFMEATPEFFSRIKFVPDFKKEECVGDMYYCNPATNRWSNCSNMRIIKTFADNLDINPDLFAVNNGVFDSSSRDTVVFRKVEMTDNISRCAKWDYQGEDNHHLKRCKEELDDFLRKVMRVDEERDVVLAFFAGLLSGRRKEKKFLAFTDKTSGDNGKSTLMALLGSFFDEYRSSNGTKFMTKGSFAMSRDDHDVGLKPMKGLLIEHFRRPVRSSIFDNLPVSMTEWKSGILDSANPLTEWLEEVVDVTGASSDAVWIGDLKCRWKESHYGHDTASVFSTKLVKAFFAGKQGTEWKQTARIEKKGKGEVNNKNSNIWDLSSRDILTRGAIAMVMIVVTNAIAVVIRGIVLAKDRDIVAVTLQQSDDAGKEFGNIKTDDKRSVLTRLIALMAFWGVLGNFLSGVLIATFAIYRIGDTIQVKDVMGIVVDFRLLHTVVRDFHTYAYITIPNNTIYNNVTTNLSRAKNKWMHVNVKLTNVAHGGGFKEDVPDVSFVRRIIINDLLNPTKKESYPDVDFTRIKADILGKYKENGAGGVQVVVFDMTNFGTDVRIVYPVVKPSTFYAQMRLNTRVRQILSDHNVGLAFQG
eukprot:gene3040-biopygen20783